MHSASRYPVAGKRLARSMGYEFDGSEADFRVLGRKIPFAHLVPR